MKALITERFKFLISWLKKEGYFKTNKELGALVGITNESTLSTAINGTRPNHSFVERVCELDARINIQWLYNLNIDNMLYNEQTSLANFKDFRRINNLTQQQAADYFGCLQSFISQIETGRSAVPESFISKILADGIYVLPANMSRASESSNEELVKPTAKEDKEVAIMAKTVNALQDTIVAQKALIELYKNEIKRLQRALSLKGEERKAASAVLGDED